MMDFGMATCCCEKCDCVEECEFFAQSIKPVVEAVNANYDPADRYIKALEIVVGGYMCDYFEPKK